MRRPRLPRLPAPPHGLLSLTGLAWLVALLFPGLWLLAGLGLALVVSAPVGFLALVGADAIVEANPRGRNGGRRG